MLILVILKLTATSSAYPKVYHITSNVLKTYGPFSTCQTLEYSASIGTAGPTNTMNISFPYHDHANHQTVAKFSQTKLSHPNLANLTNQVDTPIFRPEYSNHYS